MQHQTLFVFDIETVPDTDAVPNLTGFREPGEEARRAELERYHLEITDGHSGFPRQPFHRVVAISFLEAEIEYSGVQETYYLKELRSGGEIGFDEFDEALAEAKRAVGALARFADDARATSARAELLNALTGFGI